MGVNSRGIKSWDDYFIPGTRTLKNLVGRPSGPYGVEDPVKLAVLEQAASTVRIAELQRNPLQGDFDYTHFKATHRYIFQDIYEWAGEERVAPTDRWMTKGGHAYYPAGPVLTEAAETQFRKLEQKDLLRGLAMEAFVSELAEIWGEINVIHSFREGNTRTQVVFFSDLARKAGFELPLAAFRDKDLPDAFIEARFHSQDTGDNTPLAEVLRRVVR